MGVTIPFTDYALENVDLSFYGYDASPRNVAVLLLGLFVISKVVGYQNALRSVSYMPGLRAPFYSLQLPGAALPTSWWNPGINFPWLWREKVYKNDENISYVSWIDSAATIYTSNMDVARQVIQGGHRSPFIKPESMSRALLGWGMNLIASESEVWRRHRRVVAPAFNASLNIAVWDKTRQIYYEMVKHEMQGDVVELMPVQRITFKMALSVIGECGFGIPFKWDAPPVDEDGNMTVQEALSVVTSDYIFTLNIPKWVRRLPTKKIRRFVAAHTAMGNFMKKQVQLRKERVRKQIELGETGKSDVFDFLVRASEEGDPKVSLSDDDLVGNVFGLLLAGHETSAHTLAATLAMLSIHPDVQEEVLEEVMSVLGRDREPAFSDYASLPKVLAAFYEGIRMFPAGSLMIRQATEDTSITLPNSPGQPGSSTLPIPKGVSVVVDMVGVHYNPRYFPDPEAYKPSRWYNSSDAEEFTAFSVGPRACIGRKFATTEAVCWIAMVLRDWNVEPILNKDETFGEWRARCLQAQQMLTLGVNPLPLRFTRRKVDA